MKLEIKLHQKEEEGEKRRRRRTERGRDRPGESGEQHSREGEQRTGKRDLSGLLLPRLQIFGVRFKVLHSHCFCSSKDESQTK